MIRRVGSTLICLALGGCLSQNVPPAFHYFHPALPDQVEGEGSLQSTPLNLGRISSAAYLHAEMVWRLSDVELAFDDLNRWVEDPALLLREALELVLYREAGFRYSAAADALTADFHLRRFEQRLGSDGEVCVQFMLTVQGAVNARRLHEVHVHVPLEGEGPAAAAVAMGTALYRAARQVADHLRDG